jgi:hypothetical protein
MDKQEPMMVEQQRDEIKRLCRADVTQEGAQHFIEDLKKQMVE